MLSKVDDSRISLAIDVLQCFLLILLWGLSAEFRAFHVADRLAHVWSGRACSPLCLSLTHGKRRAICAQTQTKHSDGYLMVHSLVGTCKGFRRTSSTKALKDVRIKTKASRPHLWRAQPSPHARPALQPQGSGRSCTQPHTLTATHQHHAPSCQGVRPAGLLLHACMHACFCACAYDLIAQAQGLGPGHPDRVVLWGCESISSYAVRRSHFHFHFHFLVHTRMHAHVGMHVRLRVGGASVHCCVI